MGGCGWGVRGADEGRGGVGGGVRVGVAIDGGTGTE